MVCIYCLSIIKCLCIFVLVSNNHQARNIYVGLITNKMHCSSDQIESLSFSTFRCVSQLHNVLLQASQFEINKLQKVMPFC